MSLSNTTENLSLIRTSTIESFCSSSDDSDYFIEKSIEIDSFIQSHSKVDNYEELSGNSSGTIQNSTGISSSSSSDSSSSFSSKYIHINKKKESIFIQIWNLPVTILFLIINLIQKVYKHYFDFTPNPNDYFLSRVSQVGLESAFIERETGVSGIENGRQGIEAAKLERKWLESRPGFNFPIHNLNKETVSSSDMDHYLSNKREYKKVKPIEGNRLRSNSGKRRNRSNSGKFEEVSDNISRSRSDSTKTNKSKKPSTNLPSIDNKYSFILAFINNEPYSKNQAYLKTSNDLREGFGLDNITQSRSNYTNENIEKLWRIEMDKIELHTVETRQKSILKSAIKKYGKEGIIKHAQDNYFHSELKCIYDKLHKADYNDFLRFLDISAYMKSIHDLYGKEIPENESNWAHGVPDEFYHELFVDGNGEQIHPSEIKKPMNKGVITNLELNQMSSGPFNLIDSNPFDKSDITTVDLLDTKSNFDNLLTIDLSTASRSTMSFWDKASKALLLLDPKLFAFLKQFSSSSKYGDWTFENLITLQSFWFYIAGISIYYNSKFEKIDNENVSILRIYDDKVLIKFLNLSNVDDLSVNLNNLVWKFWNLTQKNGVWFLVIYDLTPHFKYQIQLSYNNTRNNFAVNTTNNNSAINESKIETSTLSTLQTLLISMYTNLQNQVSQLRKVKKDENKKLTDLKNSDEHWKSKISKYNPTKPNDNRYLGKLKGLKHLVLQLEQENFDLSKKIDELSLEEDTLQKTFSDSELINVQEITDLKQQIGDHNTKILERKQTVKKLNLENESIDQKLQKLINKQAIKNDEVKSLNNELLSMKKDFINKFQRQTKKNYDLLPDIDKSILEIKREYDSLLERI